MEEFKKTLEDHPDSELYKYWDFIELKLRLTPGQGCFKINGTVEQVQRFIYIILKRFWKDG